MKVEEFWDMVCVERNSKNAFIVLIENRSENTMYLIIHNYILTSTTCITDEWKAYKAAFFRISTVLHITVNHSISFVNFENPLVHTSTIEGFFSHTKKFLREKYGVDKDKDFKYIVFFIWMHNKEKILIV
ncbi:hypothetical protein TCON_0529 [Astathelohania contejeani]|uniref:ISXO2-like transposase domain-containing protein n=1 Tax=Astathelohania contejeani TaxID=164912 RepID=A0ABQ7I1H6_9MICR|nr:hypothetical protein TCON_0529 [Thelohania contejeani]